MIMKKINLIYIIIFSVGVLYSCNNDTVLPEETMHKVTFKVSANSDADTKVSYNMNRAGDKLIWDEGDKIAVYGKTNYYISNQPFSISPQSSPSSSATFTGYLAGSFYTPYATDTYVATYPYNVSRIVGWVSPMMNDNFTTIFPLEQKYVAGGFTGLPAVAVLYNNNIEGATMGFVTTCNVLRLKLQIDNISAYDNVLLERVEIKYYNGGYTPLDLPESVIFNISNLSNWYSNHTVSYSLTYAYKEAIKYTAPGVLIPKASVNNPLILHIGIPANFSSLANEAWIHVIVSINGVLGQSARAFNPATVDTGINTIYDTPILTINPAPGL